MRRHVDERRAAALTVEPGDALPELRVTPDRDLTVRYARASGDENPIHVDDEHARSVGLPGRVLHGLWSMAQVARALSEAGGGPASLRRLSVQFRGIGLPEREIAVAATVCDVRDGVAVVDAEAVQAGTAIVRDARGEIALPPASTVAGAPIIEPC